MRSEDAEGSDAVAVAQRAVVRQTFASFFAHCLRGYQEALVLRPPSSARGLRRLIDVPSLVAGRSAAEAALLRRLAETQSFTSLIEQRTSLSSRNGELLLFDHLADRCLSAPPTARDLSTLPALPPPPPRSRVYQVPPPYSLGGGATCGPHERWPRLRREALRAPRPIPPFNFAAAPIEPRRASCGGGRPSPAAGATAPRSAVPPRRATGDKAPQVATPAPTLLRRRDARGCPEPAPAVNGAASRGRAVNRESSGLHRLWDSPAPAEAAATPAPPAADCPDSAGIPRTASAPQTPDRASTRPAAEAVSRHSRSQSQPVRFNWSSVA